jgi:uncharacterized integral membrane protein (TIGR00698 family)
MMQDNTYKQWNKMLPGLLVAVSIGAISYGINILLSYHAFDPLVIALIIGITLRSKTGKDHRLIPGFTFAPVVFIPIGIGFYALNNLNFAKVSEFKNRDIYLLLLTLLTYFLVIILLGRMLKQKKQITYLTATGSAICGASAIAITSPAVDAEPDDTAISLLAVSIAAITGTSIIIPFIGSLLSLNCYEYCSLSGSVIQFTGLVKMAAHNILFLKKDMTTEELLSLAISIKTSRFLGLLIVIPLFASFVRKKVFIPWVLWLFLSAGLLGTWIYSSNRDFYEMLLTPYIKTAYSISWSVALAAIGLNADIKNLLSTNGTKAIVMAFAGFLAATIIFLIGFYTMGAGH